MHNILLAEAGIGTTVMSITLLATFLSIVKYSHKSGFKSSRVEFHVKFNGICLRIINYDLRIENPTSIVKHQ